MAYNANNLSKIVKERDKAENWLDYFQYKYQRHPATRPMTKVAPSNYIICSFLSVGNTMYLFSNDILSNEARSSCDAFVCISHLAF